MKQNNIQLVINSKDPEIIKMCESYWDFDNSNYNFKHKVLEIANEHKITRPKLTELVRFNSSLKIICESCNNEIKTYKTRSEINFENIVLDDKFLCFECRKDHRLSEKIASQEEMIIKLEASIKKQEWRRLNSRELELLVIITKCKTRQEIFRKIFQRMNFNSEYSKLIWKRLNTLEEMGLIWVERDKERHIINFHTSGKLKSILEEHYPEYYNNEEINRFDSLQIMLQKNPFKTSNNQPDYSGNFYVKKEILLKPETDYSYGAWLNDDGTIFFRIEPLDQKYKREKDDKTELKTEE